MMIIQPSRWPVYQTGSLTASNTSNQTNDNDDNDNFKSALTNKQKNNNCHSNKEQY